MKIIRCRVSDLQVEPAGKARPLLDHAHNLDVGIIGRVQIQRKVQRCVPCIAISGCGLESRMYQLDPPKPFDCAFAGPLTVLKVTTGFQAHLCSPL